MSTKAWSIKGREECCFNTLELLYPRWLWRVFRLRLRWWISWILGKVRWWGGGFHDIFLDEVGIGNDVIKINCEQSITFDLISNILIIITEAVILILLFSNHKRMHSLSILSKAMNTFIGPLDNNKNNNGKNWGQISRRANARSFNLATRFLCGHLSWSNCTVSEVSGQGTLNNQHNSSKLEWSLAGWASAILRQKRYRL